MNIRMIDLRNAPIGLGLVELTQISAVNTSAESLSVQIHAKFGARPHQ
jgi:hypothetical protein